MVHISTFTDVFQNRHASSFFKRKADLPKHLEDMLTERKLPLTSLIFKILICGIRRGSIITSISFTIILSIYSKIRFCKINWGGGGRSGLSSTLLLRACKTLMSVWKVRFRIPFVPLLVTIDACILQYFNKIISRW